MDGAMRDALAGQSGAALAMLENAIGACPESLWGDRERTPEYWAVVFHTLFWFDFYLADSATDFAPPPPFGLEELDPAGVLPPRVYTRAELLAYLEHGRTKLRARLEAVVGEAARARIVIGSFDGSAAALLLYNLRHVQHHAGQLQLLLRQAGSEPPRWVPRQRP